LIEVSNDATTLAQLQCEHATVDDLLKWHTKYCSIIKGVVVPSLAVDATPTLQHLHSSLTIKFDRIDRLLPMALRRLQV
jgi:hypothetical protein